MAEVHDRSRRQEARSAARFGGTLSKQSGAGWARKGDHRNERFYFEMKRTDNRRSYTLKVDDLITAHKNATQVGRVAVFGVEIAGRNYIVMREDDWAELVEGDDG